MGFICPQCSQGSLSITARMELEGDSRSDEIALQWLDCSSCAFAGIAVYEESRRGALDSECYDHYGYSLDEEDLRSLRALLAQCPAPDKSSCACAAHQRLNRVDANGRWNALESYEKRSYFPMRFVESP